jgi:hypothetical protein
MGDYAKLKNDGDEPSNRTQPLISSARRRKSAPEETVPNYGGKPFFDDSDLYKEGVCGIGYEVRQVKDVDCVLQKYLADFSIFFKWYCPEFKDGPVGKDVAELVDAEEITFPEVFIGNAVDVERKDIEATVEEGGMIFMEIMYTGVLSEFMELEMFPLDIQDLSIVVRAKDVMWRFKPFKDETKRRIRETVELVEWTICYPQMKVSVTNNGRCSWKLMMKVVRKPDYYITNVVLIVFAIATICFFAFLFPIYAWEDRANLLTTLLLTAVTFKFVVAQSLPKVPFFTLLDVYIVFALVMMVIIILWSASMRALWRFTPIDESFLRLLDIGFLGSSVMFWTFGNLRYFSKFYKLKGKLFEEVGRPIEGVVTNQEDAGGAVSRILGTE